MKFICLLLVASCACAQTPATAVRRDSIPEQGIGLPNNILGRMPTIRPGNSFYRNPNDPPRVLRATLDNMPVKGPDSSVRYTMQQLPGYVPKIRPKKR